MAVTPAFCPLSLQVLFNADAQPIVGGSIFVYAAGTTQEITTFADGGMDTANPNPLISDGFGRIPPIYVGEGNYKLVAQDASGAQLFVADNLPGGVDYVAQATAAAQTAGAALATALTGDVKFKHGSGIDTGWLILNGETIGNAQTPATARANADTQALFVYLWNNDASLAVYGGRGVTATADYQAAKTITLPDYRGRIACGCDQMGAPATAGVLSAASTATPNTVGSDLGSDTVTLSVAQLPVVTPTITIDGGQPGGTHTHVAATDQQGQHNHTGQTTAAGSHNHTVPITNISNVGGGGGPQLANNGAPSGSTNTVPDHQHTILADGLHNHNVTVDGGVASPGLHTHTASSSAIGSSQAHPNMPPAILGYWHIKL